MHKNGKIYRKKVIVFGFEGKPNKTEINYFQHYKPVNDEYILKLVSSGYSDPVNIVKSIKEKRKDYDYNAKRGDLTYIFLDSDADANKEATINSIIAKLTTDTRIIVSSPCFEVWFLNHFILSTKE